MKRWILLGVSILAAFSCTAASLQVRQQALAAGMIRLHVRANSDSAHDQAIKLQVRDAVLAVTEGMDKSRLEQSLPAIGQAASNCLKDLGEAQPVTVSLGYSHFPTRYYEGFALPAGMYRSLQVHIGTGQGRNWWCVAFPSLCLRATLEEAEEAAVSAGFREDEWKLMTEDGGSYVLKFKLLEWLDWCRQQF